MKKICMILILCLVAMVAYGQADSKDNPIMDIKAVGLDVDIPGARTSIKAEIVLDGAGNPLLLKELVFSTKIYDELGEKVYTIEFELENVGVAYPFANWCDVREVMWVKLWLAQGLAKVKTTDIDIEIEYRGNTIILPNTHGQYVNVPVVVLISPNGEYVGGVWPEGGWAFAGVVTSLDPFKTFGGVTWLTKFMEKWLQ